MKNKRGSSNWVETLYRPEVLERCGIEFAGLARQYLELCQQGKATSGGWLSGAELTAELDSRMGKPPRVDLAQAAEVPLMADVVAGFRELAECAFRYSRRLHAPHYLGHQVPPVIPFAAFLDAIGSLTNQSAAIYEMGPFAAAAEQAVHRSLSGLLGWRPADTAAVFMNGGSLANLTGLLAARNIRYGSCWRAGVGGMKIRPAVIAGADTHYSVSRALGILGMGTDQVIQAPLNSKRQLDVERLPAVFAEAAAKRLDVFAVVASAGTTAVGAFDPLADISDVCRQKGAWLHVDGAHGASLLVSQKYRKRVAGLESADTIAWDAHKMLFVPSACTMLLYRQRAHSFRIFEQQASYLFGEDEEQLSFDGALRTLECTKHANVTSLWGILSLFGVNALGTLVDRCIDATRVFHDMLLTHEDFEVVHEPECNILCFRYCPMGVKGEARERVSRFQTELRELLVREGDFYITQTVLDGCYALRTVVLNPIVTREVFESLIERIRETGKRLLSGIRR